MRADQLRGGLGRHARRLLDQPATADQDQEQTPDRVRGEMSLVLDGVDAQLGPGGFLPIALQVWSEATLDPTIGAIVKDRYQALRASMRVLIVHAIEAGEFPPDADVDATTAAFYGLMPGYALQRLLTGVPDKETYMIGVRTLLNPST
jgi:hypothetical protein